MHHLRVTMEVDVQRFQSFNNPGVPVASVQGKISGHWNRVETRGVIAEGEGSGIGHNAHAGKWNGGQTRDG